VTSFLRSGGSASACLGDTLLRPHPGRPPIVFYFSRKTYTFFTYTGWDAPSKKRACQYNITLKNTWAKMVSKFVTKPILEDI
jgi:hypothetical protein